MNIFQVNSELKMYAYPIVKIILALTIIVLCVTRYYLIDINNRYVNLVLTIACFVLTVLSIFCIYISVGEIGYTYENRIAESNKSKSVDSFCSKDYTVAEIVNLVEQNDIMDIVVKGGESLVYIGSSSDCKNQDSKFFNKLYYVGKNELTTIEKFEAALIPLSKKGNKISVISIDGIKP